LLARWAVFVSGNGSNLESLLANPYFKQKILYVFTNNVDAKAVLRVKRKGFSKVSLIAIQKENYNQNWAQLANQLNTLRIRNVFLLGFMRIIPENFLEIFKGEVFNIHPSILPEFKGIDAFSRSFEARQNVGVSLHSVNEFLDEGRIQIQKSLNSCFKSDLMMYNNKVLARCVHSFVEQNLVRCFFDRNFIRVCRNGI